MNDLVTVLAFIAAGATSVTIIWKSLKGIWKGIRKFARVLSRLEEAIPVLTGIADEFKTNGGNSLRDKINELTTAGEVATKVAENSRLVAETNAKIVQELTSTQTLELLGFKDYLHTNIHELRNEISKAILVASNNGKKVIQLEKTVENLIPLVNRTREGRPYARESETRSDDNDNDSGI